ncbi:MAG: CHAT domain-containing protein [Leptospiraceae bacterium]|nr:CHAT domain-containing protein [Leptospiraceae bacterium]
MYLSKGEFQRAIGFHKKAIKTFVYHFGKYHNDVSISYVFLGDAYESAEDFPIALENFLIALDIQNEINPQKDDLIFTKIYQRIGTNYSLQGKYDEALEYYNLALKIQEKIGVENHPDKATSYNNIGLVHHSKGEYDKALEYHNLALKIQEKIGVENHPNKAKSYNNIGLVHHSKGDLNTSLKYFQLSLNILIKNGDYPDSIQVIVAMTSIYLKQNKIPESIELLTQATNLMIRIHAEMQYDLEYFLKKYIVVFHTLSDLYLQTGETAKALESIDRIRSLSLNNHFLFQNALLKSGASYTQTQSLLETKGQLDNLFSQKRALLNTIKEKTNPFLEKTSFELTKEIEELNSKFESQEKKLPEKYFQLKNNSNLSLSDLKSQLKKNELFIEYSSKYDEYGDISSVTAFVISPESEKLIEVFPLPLDTQINTWIHNLLLYNIRNHPSSDHRSSLRLLKSTNKQDRFTNVEECGPIKIGEECIKNRRFYDSKNPEKEFIYKKVNLGKRIHAQLSMLRKIYLQTNRKLYNSLIGPILEKFPNTKKIILSPDFSLSTIPFSILIDKNEQRLGKFVQISLIHSTSIWMELQKRDSIRYDMDVIAFGNPIYNEYYQDNYPISKDLTLSPNSEKPVSHIYSPLELRNIEKHFGKSNTILKLGIQANTDEVFNEFSFKKKDRTKYRVIHFSAHGHLDPLPEKSGIELSRKEVIENYFTDQLQSYGKPLEKGDRLKYMDLAELDMTSELTVLSACETGLGEDRAGEGIVGLPQALIKIGSRNVMVSLWKVSARGTLHFMDRFYYYLVKENKTPSLALKATQEEMESSKEFSDPYFWAGFVIYGE